MRLRFPPARRGTDAPAELDARIAAFWNSVGGELSAFSRRGAPAEDVHALERTVSAALDRVADGLSVEIDVLADRKVRAVISAFDGGAPEPLVHELLKKTPKSERFTAVRHRPALPLDEALADVRTRGARDLAGGRVRVGFGRGHLLEIVVYSHAVSSAADEAALDAANMLVPRLIGGQEFDDWVGSLEVAPLPRGGSLRVLNPAAKGSDDTLLLSELQGAVEAAMRGATQALPEAPYHAFCEHAEWTLLEMTPRPEDDYAAQDDLAFLSTMVPECMKSFLQGAPFSSRRFSRNEESFAYVKIDVSARAVEERHELRIELEDRLNALLVPGRAGCVVGAGLGVRYLYLELALERLDDAVRLVQSKLTRLGIGPRAWILFCDDALRHEWVGVGDDMLEPPRFGER